MCKDKLRLYNYALKHGLEELIKNHALINGKPVILTDEQIEELKTYHGFIKINYEEGFDFYDRRTIHRKLRRILKCRWFDRLTYDLK